MKNFFKFYGSLALVLSANGCAHLNTVYEAIAPPAQYDHNLSELGIGSVRAVDDLDSLKWKPNTEFSLQQPRILDLDRDTYVILQVDSGGMMGITPAILVSKIEEALQHRHGFESGKLREVVSVCIGSSLGALITGAVAAGVPGEQIAEFYTGRAYDLFQGRGRLPLAPILQAKLNREEFQSEMVRTMNLYSDYPPTVRLREMKPVPLVSIAAYDLVSKRTVFLRNHRDFDSAVNARDMQLIDAVGASALSGAVFFGKLAAPDVEVRQLRADGTGYQVKGAIFADGGQGTQNSTLAVAAAEALRIKKAHPRAQVVLISLGTGNDFGEREFKKVLKFGPLAELSDFFFRNQARSESIQMQYLVARKIEEVVDDMKVFRFDWHHSSLKDANPFSINSKQRQFLIERADEIAARADFTQLLRDLSNNRLRLVQHQF